MPFVPLNCTNCGSGDVQEVKPGTYFCNHCESVFKFVDPTKLTVGPAFCGHGNPVTIQCQICKQGICYQRCDAVPAWTSVKDWVWMKKKDVGIVRTQGFGYDSADGPYLGLGKLLKSLAMAHRINLIHVCYDCVAGAVPIAAEYIASGAICQTSWCLETNTTRCPCCGGFFCTLLCRKRLPHSEPGVLLKILVEGAGLGGTISWDGDQQAACCNSCLWENEPKARAIAVAICQRDYAGRLLPFESNLFKLAAPRLRKGKKWGEDLKRQSDTAAEYAAEVSERVNQRMALSGTCDRQQPPPDIAAYFSPVIIVDERDRIDPRPISKVLSK